MNQSGTNVAHVTTAELSWHVCKFGPGWIIQFQFSIFSISISFIDSQYKSITTTTTDLIHTSNGTPFCKYSALPIHHGKFPPRSHEGHPLSGLYVEVRGANYEFIHELKKVIVFSLSNCVQYRFHLTAMYRESVAPVKQWTRFTVKSVHTQKNMSQMHFRNV